MTGCLEKRRDTQRTKSTIPQRRRPTVSVILLVGNAFDFPAKRNIHRRVSRPIGTAVKNSEIKKPRKSFVRLAFPSPSNTKKLPKIIRKNDQTVSIEQPGIADFLILPKLESLFQY